MESNLWWLIEAKLLQVSYLHREVINLRSEAINLPSEPFSLCLHMETTMKMSYSHNKLLKKNM